MEKTNNIHGDERADIYEVGFHIVPIVSVDTLPAEVDAIRSLIESNGGDIIAEDAPKLRNLAYTLSRMAAGKREKFNNAYFGWVKFEMATENIAKVKDGLDKNFNVLRHLIIKTVRENTMVSLAKIHKPEEAKEEVKAEKPAATPASEEEIDKTIDELVKE